MSNLGGDTKRNLAADGELERAYPCGGAKRVTLAVLMLPAGAVQQMRVWSMLCWGVCLTLQLTNGDVGWRTRVEARLEILATRRAPGHLARARSMSSESIRIERESGAMR